MHAIILAGGFGTRLRSVIPDLPKPMAPIHDKPFLAHLLIYLKAQGITDIILSLHYQAEKITEYFQSQYEGLRITYTTEEKPLGTGGAIINALTHYHHKQPIFVLNGDTMVKMNYQTMLAQHNNAQISMALRHVDDCSRYGKVLTNENRIIEFKEKGEPGSGYINAGVYLIQPDLFAQYSLPQQFSLEQDFIFPHIAKINAQAFITEDYFIDIGIPEDYARAINEF